MNSRRTARVFALLTIFAFFSMLLLPSSLWAAARTASASGNWSATTTWGGSAVPVVGDAVTISSAATVTVDVPAVCASIAIAQRTTSGSNGITITSGQSLTVSGAITTVAPGEDNYYTTILVNGALSAGSISLQGGGKTITTSRLQIAAGATVTCTGDITGNQSYSLVQFTGAGTLNAGGVLLTTGTFTLSSGCTVNYNGAAAQAVKAGAYSNLILAGSGVKSLVTGTSAAVNLSVAGSASVSIGTGLNLTAATLSLGGAGQLYGTWGGSGSAAANINTTWFAATTGILTVATSTAVTPPASAANSTVTALPTSVTADGINNSTITVTLLDSGSLPAVGKTVTLASNRGATDTISAASGISNASGVVTFTVKSTTTGSPVFTATDTTDTVVVTQTATVNFTAVPPANVAQSTVTASPTAVPADGVTTSTITVTAKDSGGNPLATKAVTLASSRGATDTISAASGTSGANGVVTYTVRSATSGSATFTATVTTDSVAVTQTAAVNFTATPIVLRGTTTTATSVINTLAIDMPAGVVQGDVMIANLAQYGSTSGNPTCPGWTLISGAALGGSTSRYGALMYKVAGAGEAGPYTFTLTSTVTGAGGAITAFSGIDPGNPLDVAPVAIVTANLASVGATAITTAAPNTAVIMFGMAATTGSGTGGTWGSWSAGLTEIYDYQGSGTGNTATSLGAAMLTMASPGTTGIGAATLSTSMRSGGIWVALRPLTPPASATTSTVGASPSTVLADGYATSTITVTLLNGSSSPAVGKTVTLASSRGATDTITPALGTTNVSGVATFTVKSLATGSPVFTATDVSDSFAVNQTASMTFAPVPPANNANSTVAAAPGSVPADGATTSTITVTLKDSGGTPVASKTVSLASNRGASDTITAASGTSDASGVVTFTVKSTTPGSPVFTATVTTDSVVVNQTATVTFTASSAKDFLTFGPGATIDTGAATIAWSPAFGSDLTNLAPTFTLSPFAMVSPPSGTSRNFLTPQTYTVTAQDGTTKNYTVTVTSAIITSGGATLTATINDLGAASSTSHYAVVWLTKADGTFVTTLWKQGTSSFTGTNWVQHFPAWENARGSSTALPASPDGYTSATATSYAATSPSPPTSGIASNPINITWNGKDASGNPMPNGDYKFWIEYAENTGTHNTDTGGLTTTGLLWTKGPSASTVNPVNQGTVGTPTGGFNFTNMSIVWTPAVTPVPLAPTGLTPTPTITSIGLNWTASTGAVFYTVKRSTTSGLGYTIIGMPSGTTYTDNAVIPGTTYDYVVSASNSGGESPNSTEINAATTTAKLDQTVSFTLGSSLTKFRTDTAFADVATATSGLAVTYSSDNASVATVDPATGTVTLTGVGMAHILADQPGSVNYNAAPQVSQTLTVTKAMPVITWSNPASIGTGTPLSATQLNASSGGVAGNFAYTPPLGTVLAAGTGQSLKAEFTPTDTATYDTPAAKFVTIDVITYTYTAGGAAFSATINDLGATSSARHLLVVWVTTSANVYVLPVWKQGNSGSTTATNWTNSSNWAQHFATFTTQRGGNNANPPASPDGYTSTTATSYAATSPSPPTSGIASNPINITWNGKDSNGNLMPDGDYKFWIEYAEDAGTHGTDTGGLASFTWTKGTGSFSSNPANQGTVGTPTGGSNFTGMSIVWTPVPTTVPPTITSAAPPASGTQGTPYNYTVTATGTAPITFSVTTGTLPTGLTLSTAGVISGTPTAAGAFTGTITASNGTAPDATQGFSITIAQAIAFTSPAPPATGNVGLPYNHTCTATGTAPITFTVTSGALPTGLTLGSGGVISGTPSADGTFTGTITASNGLAPAATQNFSIVISTPLVYTVGKASLAVTLTPIDAVANEFLHDAVVWVTKADGTFIKTLWKQGPADFSGDNAQDWIDHFNTWNTARNGSTALDGYTSPTATDYLPPNSPILLTWNCKDAVGNLMPDGDYKFWVQYAERNMDQDEGPVTTNGLLWTKRSTSSAAAPPNQDPNFSNMSIVWVPLVAPVFTSAPPPATGLSGTPYSHTCTASGTTPLTFTVTSGALPTGLTLGTGGLISGTPTSTGTFTGIITAANGTAPDATQNFSIVISAPLVFTPGTADLKVTISTIYDPQHDAVVWVTKADGTFIKTLWKQGPAEFSGDNAQDWIDHFNTWNTARNGSTALDGYTSPTCEDYNPPNSPILLTWNCRDASNNVVSDGTYKFFVQYAERNMDNDEGPVTSMTWTKGSAAGTVAPADQTPNFSAMAVAWTPGNTAPSFAGYAITTPYQTAATVYTGKLMAHASDADGDAITLSLPGTSSTAGGTVTLQSGAILYTPQAAFSGADSFPVRFTDTHGSATLGMVTVTVGLDVAGGLGGQSPNQPQLKGQPNGDMVLVFQGIPGMAYKIQRSTDLATWTTLATVTANDVGAMTFTDTEHLPIAYYRLAY